MGVKLTNIDREHWASTWPEGIEYGYCWCGCGEKTRIAARTNRQGRKASINGEPLRFVNARHSTALPKDHERRVDSGSTELTCIRCERRLPVDRFSINRKINTYHQNCNTCYKLNNVYKITYQDYVNMMDEQQEKCAICLVAFETGNPRTQPCVDHCHTTGKVRGILCADCNKALGFLKEDSGSMRRMIAYVGDNNGS